MARMDLTHRLIVAAVALLVFGGGAAMFYSLYVHPKAALRGEERRMERAAQNLADAPDPAETDFAAAAAAVEASPARTRAIWEQYLEQHPDAPQAAAARAALGPLNIENLFSATPGESKTTHTVVRGDSLYRIARQHGVTIDLIARANNLSGTMLQIGQTLVVPQPEITATVDRTTGTLRLDNRGAFLREYPLLSARLPGLPADTPAETRVVETVVNDANGRRVTFGQKNYDEGTRQIVLSSPGQSISGADPGTPEAELPPGLVVKNTDLGEIFVLLRRGVPVTIK